MRTRFAVILLSGIFAAPGVVRAGPIPEPTPGIPQEKSVAYRAETPPVIDGDLSDWEGAVFKLIGRQQDVYRGEWTGPDDLTCTWSVRWDTTTFYFAAAIRDDVLVEAVDPQQPWTGDCLFLYIDADVDGTIDNKPAFFLLGGKPAVLGMAGGAESATVELAIVTEPRLGKAGRILEAAIPLDCLTNMKPAEGVVFRMMPGYEEGTQGAEAPPTFLDWDGLDPDNAANLRQVIFGGAIGTHPWAMARNPDPPDGTAALGAPLFRWTAGDGAVLHNVYVGKSPDLGPADLAASRTPLALYYHALPLEAGVTYYWRVDEVEADGQTIHTGTVWSFTTKALTAYKPSPADGANAVSTAPTLTWMPGQATVKHQVFFSDNLEAIQQRAASADKGLLTDPTFAATDLQGATTYYWAVDEVIAGGGVKAGPVWSFTTILPVDDFESYTDDEGSRIYETWVDGWTNNTGSTVGYTSAPFAEQKIVHGGKQSMPLDYNNINSPFYSEAEREFAPAQDWTINGVGTLAVFFRGRSTNGAAPVYVTLRDASNRTATVTYTDATAVTKAKWAEWKIPLADFAGVNAAKVKKIVIGVGDKSASAPGSAGLIYIDDIQLTRPAPAQ